MQFKIWLQQITESQELHFPNLNHEELESLSVAQSLKENLGRCLWLTIFNLRGNSISIGGNAYILSYSPTLEFKAFLEPANMVGFAVETLP